MSHMSELDIKETPHEQIMKPGGLNDQLATENGDIDYIFDKYSIRPELDLDKGLEKRLNMIIRLADTLNENFNGKEERLKMPKELLLWWGRMLKLSREAEPMLSTVPTPVKDMAATIQAMGGSQ